MNCDELTQSQIQEIVAGLPARRRTMYDAIIEYKQTHDGNSPSIDDLMAMTGFKAKSSVFFHLECLEFAGLITRDYNAVRSIQVVGGSWSYQGAGAHG